MAKPYRRKGSRFWYISPWIEGRQVPQSSKTTDYDTAERALRVLEGKIASGAPIKAKTDRGVFSELLEMVRTDYTIKENASIYDAEKRLDLHIIPALGHLPSGKVSTEILNEYIIRRRIGKAKNATINRELALIKRAFTLGMQAGLISMRPHIEMLREDNVRQGFFSEEAFRAVLAHSNELLRDILMVAYYTGWRIESILNLQWRQVDLVEGSMRLYANQTKNRKDCFFPLDLYADLKTAIERRKEDDRRKGIVCPFVFNRSGEKVISIRESWDAARIAAGVPGRLLHDFRRTAVRNLKTLGFSDTEVMNMVGLKTLSMLIRYNITTEEDIRQKAKLIAKRVGQN